MKLKIKFALFVRTLTYVQIKPWAISDLFYSK